MTPTEVAAKLRAFNDWRRGGDIEYPGPLTVDEAIDAAVEMIDRLEAAEKERDALRAKITRMEQQEPVGEIVAFGESLHEVSWNRGKLPPLGAKLYALPGAQNVPEKLCYDSRWEIPIDYVDGWNAAVDMMRGKSPSWHCPDCCIAFPFGAPKSCPNDDARCNSLLAAAPEAKP